MGLVFPVGVSLKSFFYYYETIKRDLNRRHIYECRCNERLKGMFVFIIRVKKVENLNLRDLPDST